MATLVKFKFYIISLSFFVQNCSVCSWCCTNIYNWNHQLRRANVHIKLCSRIALCVVGFTKPCQDSMHGILKVLRLLPWRMWVDGSHDTNQKDAITTSKQTHQIVMGHIVFTDFSILISLSKNSASDLKVEHAEIIPPIQRKQNGIVVVA